MNTNPTRTVRFPAALLDTSLIGHEMIVGPYMGVLHDIDGTDVYLSGQRYTITPDMVVLMDRTAR